MLTSAFPATMPAGNILLPADSSRKGEEAKGDWKRWGVIIGYQMEESRRGRSPVSYS